MNWEMLDILISRGSSSGKASNLGGLHAKRLENLSQFFTPAWIVSFIWRTIAPAFNCAGRRYSLFDNSLGSASMFRYADPERHSLHGFDIDGDLIARVSEILDGAGFSLDIRQGALEAVAPGAYSVGLINPPFSLTLSAPTLRKYENVTCYGRHGPDTSALSHKYALAQALEHCDIVCAVVPRTLADEVNTWPAAMKRLRARYKLPGNAFAHESVRNVATDLLIFDRLGLGQLLDVRAIDENSEVNGMLQLSCRTMEEIGSPSMRLLGVEECKPTIKASPSPDKTVLLNRAGRRIYLKFFDGVTEARVLNRILEGWTLSDREHRYPRATRYTGQYRLSLDVLAMQEDPFKALAQVLGMIREAGGEPIVSSQLQDGLKSVMREHRKMAAPFGHVAYRVGSSSVNAQARALALLNRIQKGAVVKKGEQVKALRASGGFNVETDRGVFFCDEKKFFDLFEVSEGGEGGYWEEIHPPLKEAFPQQIAQLKAKAFGLGLNKWLSWDYQMEDLLELAMKPRGAICGWQMALGKTRLALSLARLLDGPSLLVVKSRLVNELMLEIKGLGVPDSDFQVIQTISDVNNLRKLNVISYERLKSPFDERFPKIFPGKLLRKKVSNVIADEGGLLANMDSQQTRAVWAIQAKRRYIFDGTPCPNYPREMLALAAWTVGQERSYQPYSLSGGHLYPELFKSAVDQKTGRDAFTDHFLCYEWATNEFLDSGKGAKREVPRVKSENLEQYRRWVGRMIKRRLQQEPAVQKYVSFPVPTIQAPTTIDWDLEHLALYVKTADEFAAWYRTYMKEQAEKEKSLNLALILARLEACFKAANVPSLVSGYAVPYTALTSKERACLERIEARVKAGQRPIVFARNPHVLNRLAKELDKRGISNFVFCGQETIASRNKSLGRHVRNGTTSVMLASIGVTQDGLNLHQLDCCIFYNRSWKAREEFQAIYRLIRPQQKSAVEVEFLQLSGSIDEYMGQLVEWKGMASQAGLDYGHQPDDEYFSHFDAFIHRFLESVPVLKAQISKVNQRYA